MYTYDESIFAKKNKWLLPLILFLVLGGLGAVALLIRYEVISVPAISGMIAPEPLLAIGVVMCCAGFIFLLKRFPPILKNVLASFLRDEEVCFHTDVTDVPGRHALQLQRVVQERRDIAGRKDRRIP